MIINKSDYKKNPDGEIIKRQRVEVSCDKCGKVKETLYGEYKRRLHKEKDYCRACSNILGITGCKGRKSGSKTKIEMICECCGKKTLKYKSHTKKYNHIFCSSKCNLRYDYEKRYSYLMDNCQKYQNELCYLMGAILGDGTVVGRDKNTSRIAIYCDVSKNGDVEIINNINGVLDIVRINHSTVKNRKNCKAIVFNLPNLMLSKFNMLFSGDKFKAQPHPSKKCIGNINFAIGLFNSDGYFVRRSNSGCMVLSFNNTVRSIVDSLKECLTINSIYHVERIRKKRKKGWKKSYDVIIERQKEINNLIKMSYFKLKKIKESK